MGTRGLVGRGLVAVFLVGLLFAGLAASAAVAAPGDPDPSYSGGASVLAAGPVRAYALLAQPDGKLVVCGVGTGGDGRRGAAVARYLPDGSLDPSFGAAGKTV